MDIDDILREVDPISSGVPRSTRDLQALTRCWVSERSAPELFAVSTALFCYLLMQFYNINLADVTCRWPADGLFERVNDNIKDQIERVEEMTGDMDPKTNFALIVMQTELERYKFLARSYLRARIAKVCLVSFRKT